MINTNNTNKLITNTNTIEEKEIWSSYLVERRFVSHGGKGGRINRISCLVIVSNGTKIGYAQESSKLFANAFKKSFDRAKSKSVFYSFNNQSTINLSMNSKYKGSKVLMWPLKSPSGYKCSHLIKVIFEFLNIKNIGAKIYGSGNRNNIIAVFKCLNYMEQQLQRINARYYIQQKRNQI